MPPTQRDINFGLFRALCGPWVGRLLPATDRHPPIQQGEFEIFIEDFVDPNSLVRVTKQLDLRDMLDDLGLSGLKPSDFRRAKFEEIDPEDRKGYRAVLRAVGFWDKDGNPARS